MQQFYAYMWLRENGTPYYVGKGVGRRAFVRGSHNVKPPADHSRILVFARSSEAEALETERELIANWGRKDVGTGCLRNFTNGGDGVSGLQHTVEAKRRMSLGHRGRPSWNKGIPQTPEHIAKLSAVRKGRKTGRPCPVALHSPEAIAKSAASRTGRKLSEETKEKIRQAHIGMKPTEETLVKLRESHKGYNLSSEHRQHLSEAGKLGWLKRRKSHV